MALTMLLMTCYDYCDDHMLTDALLTDDHAAPIVCTGVVLVALLMSTGHGVVLGSARISITVNDGVIVHHGRVNSSSCSTAVTGARVSRSV